MLEGGKADDVLKHLEKAEAILKQIKDLGIPLNKQLSKDQVETIYYNLFGASTVKCWADTETLQAENWNINAKMLIHIKPMDYSCSDLLGEAVVCCCVGHKPVVHRAGGCKLWGLVVKAWKKAEKQ